MDRSYKKVEEEWRFDKSNESDMEFMKDLITTMKSKGYEILESDFDDWDCKYHDVSFSKISLNLGNNNF